LRIASLLRDASVRAFNDVADAVASRREKVDTLLPSLQKYSKTAPKSGTKEEKKKYEEYIVNIKKAAKASLEAYKDMDKEQMKRALLKTNGYLNEFQFLFGKSEVKKIAGPIGELKIGEAALQKMLDEVVKELNNEVFEIFGSLQSLSDNLNGFFASGLAADDKASDAIGDAKDIESKTEKVKTGN